VLTPVPKGQEVTVAVISLLGQVVTVINLLGPVFTAGVTRAVNLEVAEAF
jgi:hypothetical protein